MSSVLMQSTPNPERELREALIRLKDLTQPKRVIFWTDLLGSAALGWAAFAAACAAEPWSWVMFLCAALAVLPLYRASAFLHELAHLRSGALPGFPTTWNVLVGWPLLLPSVLHEGVHLDHHRASTYGTINDPEYIWVKKKGVLILGFLLAGILEPAMLAIRFLIFGPVGLVCPPWRRVLEKYMSSYKF